MKPLFILTAFLYTINASAQQALTIPDTLSGSTINLNMHADSVQFFPGNISYTYAFNTNKFLGPTLIFNKGESISINVTNQISDTTSVHWHGIHLPAIFDGGPHTPIAPNETWHPSFTIMDQAATYWYHPHMHMKTAEHVIKGAAGLIIVRDNIEVALNLPRKYGIDDFPVIVQCQQWDDNNQVLPLGMQDSIVMVNGLRANNGNSVYLDAPAQIVRLRLINASGERTFNFGFSGNKTFHQIASDGGLLNNSYSTTRIRLSPGERAEILLDLNNMQGQSIYLMCYGAELPIGVQGGPTMPMPPWAPPMDSPLNGINYNIMQINVVAPTSNPITTIPNILTNNTVLPVSSANTFREIRFTADSAMVMDGPFYFNDSTFNMMRIDYTIPLNSVEVWKLVNETMVAHPFHIHDTQFNILDRNGLPPMPNEAGRKDVVFVLPGDTVRFITKFEDFADTVIPYMYHCHILMHEDDGMMGQFIVHPNAVGLDKNFTSDDIAFFPNPFHESATIKFAKQPNDATLILENVFGQRIIEIKNINTQTYNLKNNQFSSGIYMLRIAENNQTVITKKIIVSD
ncbi:MAG TPA: multicopper oxidase domain-containing protein [Bacteroidia bacterium]|nr:multicopper oxidase domain-containing protein [Bacteroidia bacterium]